MVTEIAEVGQFRNGMLIRIYTKQHAFIPNGFEARLMVGNILLVDIHYATQDMRAAVIGALFGMGKNILDGSLRIEGVTK